MHQGRDPALLRERSTMSSNNDRPSGQVDPSIVGTRDADYDREAGWPARDAAASGTTDDEDRDLADDDRDLADDGHDSPLDVFDDQDRSRRWPKVLLWTGLGVLVLAGAYLGAQWYFADRIATDTSVAGIDIGGLSGDEAVVKLESELGALATQPLPVTAGGAASTIDPAAAGLVFDAAATVEPLTSFSLDPSKLLRQVTGGGDVAPVTTVDEDALAEALVPLTTDLEVPAANGTVAFVDGAAVQTAAVAGTSLDGDAAGETIADTWLTGTRPVDLPTVPLEPDVTQAETDAAFAEAQTFASGPVTLTVADQIVEIPAASLLGSAAYGVQDGALALTVDGGILVQAVLDRTTDLLATAADASFAFVDGVPQVQPGTPGTTLDPEALAAAVRDAALGTERTATVELTTSDPERSTEALQALGVVEKVSEFSTPLTANAARTENLSIAAGKVTGSLVMPGETFSLIDVIGPITAANGYNAASVVVNGQIQDGMGGGLSQMATTAYNAGFFAGMVDVEHQPHSNYFSRYPEGRESTIYEGVIDVKFRNDSPHGVLLQSWVADNKLWVAAWSTKYYDIQESTSGRSNVVSPTTEHRSGPSCQPQSTGSPGFSVSVWRKVTVIATGEVVIDETKNVRYKPQNAIVCDG